MASVIFSNATTPTSGDIPNISTTSNDQRVHGQTLQTTPSPHVGATMERTILRLHGALPRDEPLEHDITYLGKDSRTMLPLSIRYCANEGDSSVGDVKWQGRAASAIWARLQAISTHLTGNDMRPVIVFDEDLEDVPTGVPCVVLVFEEVEAFAAARDGLKTFTIDHETNEPITYEQDASSNTLAPHVLPIDILRFSVQHAAGPDFLAALQDLASPLGSVLGAGLICVQCDRPHDTPTSSHLIRFYVHLTFSSMCLTVRGMANKLPTSFSWQGVSYTLLYPGKDAVVGPRPSAPDPLGGVSTPPVAAPPEPESGPEPAETS